MKSLYLLGVFVGFPCLDVAVGVGVFVGVRVAVGVKVGMRVGVLVRVGVGDTGNSYSYAPISQ